MTKKLSDDKGYNYDKYKKELKNFKKVEKENKAVGQVFTKGLLPLYVLQILSISPTNGNDIATQIGKKTNGLWIPSTGGIYPLLKKFEKENLVEGRWDDRNNKMQKIYTITESGRKKTTTKTKYRRSLESI